MILIVDDDPSVTASLALLLKQAGYASHSAASPADALAWLDSHPCELVVQDMNFCRRTTGEEGLDLLARIKALRPGVPVVLITAWGSIQLAVQGMKAGATDFITKPWTHEQILQTVAHRARAGRNVHRATIASASREELDASFDFGHLVGEDPRLLRILQMIGRVSATDASVLITGESGTGKELAADAIHRNSRRRAGAVCEGEPGRYLVVAVRKRDVRPRARRVHGRAPRPQGPLRDAPSGGTIFLDEIGDLDPASQVKLLRVLQDRTFEVLGSSQRRHRGRPRRGGHQPQPGGHGPPGEFREDLLYRINLITLHLPPLRERRDDIPILASRFLQAVGQVYRREDVRLSADALAWLKNQPWPGNVRQLKQGIERTVLVTELGAPHRAMPRRPSRRARSQGRRRRPGGHRRRRRGARAAVAICGCAIRTSTCCACCARTTRRCGWSTRPG